jgi:site-specific recombinase XerD
MKSLTIETAEYRELEAQFKDWLETLSYAPGTVTTRHERTRELLYYLENNGISSTSQIAEESLNGFITYLKGRENTVYGAGLSNGTINQAIESVNIFLKFLQQNKNLQIKPISKLQRLECSYKPRTVLTLKEIDYLYQSTYIKRKYVKNHLAYGQRDRAMLGIYYGCGLRKEEGAALDTGDILIGKKLVFVRKGKGRKERYVPITESNLAYLMEYLEYGRKWFLSQHTILTREPQTEAFFIGQFGNRSTGQSLYKRLETLTTQSECASLRDKKPGLHTLRHSIATHLLKAGMDIEAISRFLGHSSLESTQIYTHIVNEL